MLAPNRHGKNLEISVSNDLAIHDIIMKKTDNSMAKLQKYENLAEKLIEGQIEGMHGSAPNFFPLITKMSNSQ